MQKNQKKNVIFIPFATLWHLSKSMQNFYWHHVLHVDRHFVHVFRAYFYSLDSGGMCYWELFFCWYSLILATHAVGLNLIGLI